jgi:hypothetical protein
MEIFLLSISPYRLIKLLKLPAQSPMVGLTRQTPKAYYKSTLYTIIHLQSTEIFTEPALNPVSLNRAPGIRGNQIGGRISAFPFRQVVAPIEHQSVRFMFLTGLQERLNHFLAFDTMMPQPVIFSSSIPSAAFFPWPAAAPEPCARRPSTSASGIHGRLSFFDLTVEMFVSSLILHNIK